MNFNISPIAFYPSRAAQPWRAWFYQRKIAVSTGENLLPFVINDTPLTAPNKVEIYNAYDDTLAATINDVRDILAHTSTVDGQSVNSWIYQGTSNGIFGYTQAGYYYLKIGNYYSDVIKFGEIVYDYVKITSQFFDDLITPKGTLISKYVVYQQIFETDLWKPTYSYTEEGKENNGIFYPTQQTIKKMSGFSVLANEAQIDCLWLAREADSVQIEARRNGVVYIGNADTNTLEIKSDWQSDDVAAVECQFDIFDIIRKYQISNEKPEPLPIPTPPTPPVSNYYIKGTANANTIVLKINNQNVNVPVVNGAFTYGYDTKLTNFAANDSAITTLQFNESCLLGEALSFSLTNCTNLQSANFAGCTMAKSVSASRMFSNCKALTSVSMPAATFVANLNVSCAQMFDGCENLTSVTMPLAKLDGATNAMFKDCIRLTTINMPQAKFDAGTTAEEMFRNCRSLTPQGITLTSATFENTTNWHSAFWSCRSLVNFNLSTILPSFVSAEINDISNMLTGARCESIDISAMDLSHCTTMNAAFMGNICENGLAFDKTNTGNVTEFWQAFYGMSETAMSYLIDADMDSATDIGGAFMQRETSGYEGAESLTLNQTFASVINARDAFSGITGGVNSDCLGSISLPNATLEAATDVRNLFANNLYLQTISAPSLNLPSNTNTQGMFANLPELVTVTIGVAATLKQSISFAQSPKLSETSINNIVNWLADLSGLTAKTITINSTAWDNLPSASQTTIAAAISAKNWTLQN
jgi:hypothetical protein